MGDTVNFSKFIIPVEANPDMSTPTKQEEIDNLKALIQHQSDRIEILHETLAVVVRYMDILKADSPHFQHIEFQKDIQVAETLSR